jgi:hypothetical protein
MRWRVRWLGKTFLLRRSKWYWLQQHWGGDSFTANFDTEEEALNAIKIAEKLRHAKIRGFQRIRTIERP